MTPSHSYTHMFVSDLCLPSMGGVHAYGNATIALSSPHSRPPNCRCSYNGGHDCLTIAEKRVSKGHLKYIATQLQTEIRSVSKTRMETY